MTSQKPTVLITGATGQIGGDTLRLLQDDDSITLVAAVRSTAKAQPFEARGIRSVIMDFDKEETLAPALQGIDRVLLVTGYTVDMLRQSKVFVDQAKKPGCSTSCIWAPAAVTTPVSGIGPGTSWWSGTLSGQAVRSPTCALSVLCKTC